MSVIDDRRTPFLGISPYVSPPADACPALQGDITAEVAIIGGGYTGLSAALALQRAGVQAVVLERDFCGWGASGRNAGHLTPTICKDLPTALLLFGAQTAARLARFADHCVETAEGLIHDLGIDCDYRASGNIMAVLHPSQEKRVRQAADSAARLGARMRYVEPGEMRERGLPPSILSGALEEAGGTLHPGKYVTGLRRAVIAHGVAVHEGTAVMRVARDGAGWRVFTGQGSVRAAKVLMASNAFTPEIGPPGQRLVPLYITLFETAPLSDAQLAAIGGWAGREGLYTTHESMESYRLTAQRTIIGGSKRVHYFYDCAPHRHGGAADASGPEVIRAFRERFPALHDLPIAHTWAGWCGFTLNFLPIVGETPGRPGCFHAVGFNGHGIAQASTMGGLLVDQMLGRANPWHELICRMAPPLPPAPLRYLVAQGLLGLFNGMDAWLDRRIRRAAG